MSIPSEFVPFAKGAPCAVMARSAVEWLIDDETVVSLFESTAESQYNRNFTMNHLLDVMLDVACGVQRSARMAYLARHKEMPASLSAFYGKLNRTELGFSEALVTHTAERASKAIATMQGCREEPIPGFRTHAIDGNMLAGTDHRLKPLRKTRAAALPGKSLAVYEHGTGLVVRVVLCEDAYTQERAILPGLSLKAGDHYLADRNFCVRWFMLKIHEADACFTIRHHKGCFPLKTVGKVRDAGRCASGSLREQTIQVETDEGDIVFWRKITLTLDEPTRDGETQIVLISNLPKNIDASTIATAYRMRWSIERHYQRLTDYLHCEIPTLGRPQAALFAFVMAVVAGNAIALIEAAIRAVHGTEVAENLSYAAVVDEISGAHRGMMIALPERQWGFLQTYTPNQFANWLRALAKYINLVRLKKTKRGPKIPRRTPNCGKNRHISTSRILAKPLRNTC